MDIMSGNEEKTSTISPDQGATGETATSVSLAEAEITLRRLTAEWLQFLKQQGEEEKARYKGEYDNTIFKVLEDIMTQSPAAGWNTWIGSLKYHFVMENRSKRSEKPNFLNLDKFEALKTEQLKTSGLVLSNLNNHMRALRVQEEFEGYLKLLRETRDCFGHGIEYMVMQYIKEHEGDTYYLNLCMSCYKEK